jgi:biopolymer transport protein ExbD
VASKALKIISKVDVELSFTSMIDVTFLLLIYFVVTSKFKASEGRMEAFLPKDRGLGTSSPKAVTETRIKLLWYDTQSDSAIEGKHGRVVLKVGNRKFDTVGYQGDVCFEPGCGQNHGSPDFTALTEFLTNAKKEHEAAKGPSEKMPVIIDARIQVPFKFVVRALNSALEAGLTDVTFAAAENPYE